MSTIRGSISLGDIAVNEGRRDKGQWWWVKKGWFRKEIVYLISLLLRLGAVYALVDYDVKEGRREVGQSVMSEKGVI